MKAIFKFSALALLASALMASCAKEVDMPVEGKKITKTFTLTFAQPDTKVAVTEAGKTTWEVGDEIMIHGGADGAVQQLVTLTANDISADGKKATITVVDMEPYNRADAGVVSEFYAQYPASLVPNVPMYYECRFTGTDDFLMAACDVDDTFVFYNLCGIIAYKVNGEFDKVVFSGNNGEIVSYETVYQVRVRNDESGMVVNYNKPGNGSGDPVSKTSNEYAIVPDGSTVNYIFLPAGANFASGFTFKFYDGVNLVKVAKTDKAVNVKPGNILALGDISSHLEDYVEGEDPVSDHKSGITGAVDISGRQANSYIISEPGAYKFPALKGNSDEAIGNVFGADIIWETYNNAEEVIANSVIAAVDFEDNWIYFKTPDTLKPGNALVAARDKDGKIIWSWHIWIPATTIKNIDATQVSGLTMMDRNLGALVVVDTEAGAAVESYGLYYQYGRKDPILGPKRVDSGSLATVAEGQATNTLNGGPMTLNESIANPTVFGNVSGGHWQSGTLSEWSAFRKTPFDPCPYGYRLAYGERGSSAPYPLWNSSSIATAAADMGWEVNKDAHWFKIGIGDGTLVFPLGGYYDDNQEGENLSCTHAGDRSGVWFMATNSSSCYHINIRADSESYKTGSTSGARGCAVRCVRTEEVIPEDPEPDPGPGPEPGPVEITIDGDMSDWANVEGIVSETGPYFAFKVAYDDENIYFYSKRNFRNDYWGDYGYYYYGMDEDNDQSTAMSDPQGMPGADEWVLIYPFGGSNDAPAIPDTPGNGGLNSWDKYTFPSNSLDGVIGTDFVETEFACPRSILKIQPGATVKFYSFGNKSASNIMTEAITLKIEGGSTPEEPHDPVKAEWLFSADAMADYADNFGGTAGVKSKEAGDGGMFVQSNVTPGGKIKYVQIDKTEIDKQDKASRIIGASGHPYVTGAWPGDYWLFELSDGYTYKAGTKVHISFLTRLSATGQKYWKLEYWDGAAWQSVGEMVEGVIEHEGFDTQTFMYNFEPTTATSNSLVDHTWVLAADCSNMQFRYTCMANYQFNGNGPLEAPNGGTCRIAGAAGTSPIFEVLADE